MSKPVLLTDLPECAWCESKARYDFVCEVRGRKTWAYGCKEHWEEHRVSHSIGVGVCTLLMTHAEAKTLREGHV